MATIDPHLATSDLGYMTAEQLSEALERGTLTSVEIVTGLLARIDAIDAPASAIGLRSILAVSDDAIAQAAAADDRRRAGNVLSPLDGIPIVVKDNIEVRGLPSSAGSTALMARPHGDAALVETLRAAGLIILGSTNLSEWANLRSPESASGWSAVGGLTANPWATDRSAGGSSSGSGAALAAGLSPLAIGTETDGSIVCPSSLNGVVGMKPTVGTISTHGIVPLSSSQDSPGPMARTVRDVQLLFEVLAPSRAKLRTAHVAAKAVVASTWKTGHPKTDALFEETMARLRAAGLDLEDREVARPRNQDQDDELTVLLCEMNDDLNAYLSSRPGSPESLAHVIHFEEQHHDVELAHFGHEFFEQAHALGGRSASRYDEARRRNLEWAITTCLEPALCDADVLVAPTYGPAWKQDLILGEDGAKAAPTTMAPAIAGWPIACVPMGLVDGMPVGIGIISRPGDEAKILDFAGTIEVTLDLNADGEFRPMFPAARRG